MTNSYRFEEILQTCEQRTAVKFRGSQERESLDDSFVITEDDYLVAADFLLEAAAVISDWSSYVRDSTQSPIEAITFLCCDDQEPEIGIKVEKGQKYPKDKPQRLTLQVDSLDEKYYQNLTVVQTFIRSAIIHYILYKWYLLKGYSQFANEEFMQYDEMLGKVRFNAISNQTRKKVHRKPRIY